MKKEGNKMKRFFSKVFDAVTKAQEQRAKEMIKHRNFYY